jgi:glycosyltransferase involved in cell wall biosynthesis
MKILISGDFAFYSRNNDLIKGFKNLGLELNLFDDQKCYDEILPIKKLNLMKRIYHRLFWKFYSNLVGENLLKFLSKDKYDLILIIKGWFYHPKTIKKIKELQPEAKLFCFNPDNPFNTWHHGVSNEWIRKSIPYYDVYFIWGKFLIDKLYQAGAKKVEYLPFWYDPEVHYPIKVKDLKEKAYYGSDIAFIGTWDKEREWWLSHLVDYDLKIWGNDWNRANKKLQSKWMKKPAYGEEFAKICNSSKIILNIIRKQNIPSHNMRTFEAPACKAFVLSTRTDEVKEFFEEDKEAAYFSTSEELKQKIDFYLKNDKLREIIREAGYQKLINSNHTYLDGSKKFLEVYEELKK